MCDKGATLNLVPNQLLQILGCERFVKYSASVVYLVNNTILTVLGEIQLYVIFNDALRLVPFTVTDHNWSLAILG